MKRIGLFSVIVAVWAHAGAQGTFQFSVSVSGDQEVPPIGSTATARGTFSLTGTLLSYFFAGPLPAPFSLTSASINGPALPGSTAPVLFDLVTPVIAVPNPPIPGGYAFSGQIENLTVSQFSQLMSGLWYVNICSTEHPDGEIRGQIVPVPEPGVFSMIILGLMLTSVRRQLRRNGMFGGQEREQRRSILGEATLSTGARRFQF